MFCEADLTELKEQGFHIPTYKAENLPPTEKKYAHKSSHPPEGVSKSSGKVESASSKTLGTASPQNLDSTIPSKLKGKLKCSPQAKEKQEKCDTEGCSSKHKDNHRSCSKKSTKCSSDKESDSTSSCKWDQSPEQYPPSGEHHAKMPCMDNSPQTPDTGSHQDHLSKLEGNTYFVAPVTSSTPYKVGILPCNCSVSRCTMTSLNTGLYSNFTYAAPPGSGFGGGLTPMASILCTMESAHITSTVYAPTEVFSPNLQFNSENLTAEQVRDVYNLVVECQALGTKLANEFQTLSGLEVIH